eukprot:2144851-Pleurochrysis_carterae.AAC.1
MSRSLALLLDPFAARSLPRPRASPLTSPPIPPQPLLAHTQPVVTLSASPLSPCVADEVATLSGGAEVLQGHQPEAGGTPGGHKLRVEVTHAKEAAYVSSK